MKTEMFICTFVYNKINLRDERRLDLILSFMFRQLEGEFAVSCPCSANNQSSVSRVAWQECGVWCMLRVVSLVNLYGMPCSYFYICP